MPAPSRASPVSATKSPTGAPGAWPSKEQAERGGDRPTTGGTLSLISGEPRSGRTEALVARALQAVQQGAPPESLLMLGDSPRAAEALRVRLSERAAALGQPAPDVMTLGELCVQLVRQARASTGDDDLFIVLGHAERLALLLDRFGRRAAPAAPAPIERPRLEELARALRHIDRLKGALVDVASCAQWASQSDPAPSANRFDLATLYREHERVLAAHGALDGGGVLWAACAALDGPSPTRGRLAERYSQVMVDGLHDVSPAMELLIDHLAATIGAATLTVDDGDAHALTLAHPGAELIALGPSREWVPDIAACARRVRGHRRARVHGLDGEQPHPDEEEARRAKSAPASAAAQPLEPGDRAEHAPLRFWRCDDEGSQARHLATDIERLLSDGAPAQAATTEPPHTTRSLQRQAPTVAVAVRSPEREGAAIVAALKERSLPVDVLAPTAFLESSEVRDLLAWLRVLIDPLDAGALTRLLVRPPVALHPAEIARVSQLARRRRIDLLGALNQVTEATELAPEARERVGALVELHGQLFAALEQLRADELLHAVIERTGLGHGRALADSRAALHGALSLARVEELA
ncbi:MAG: UvrD-helicase domain-containing protein, partial [Solirubrobacteraceae bacterium]